MTETAVAEPTTSGGSVKTKDNSEKKFLILGCGPAALIAAHTLEKKGISRDQLEIVAQVREPSKISGAQFLHAPIIGDTLQPDGFLEVLHIGFADAYASKVYGDATKSTSFGRYRSEERRDPVPAWSLDKQYSSLWKDYFRAIDQITVTADIFNDFLNSGEWDEIISTIPPVAYCMNPDHGFPSAPMLLGEPVDPLPFDNAIVYNGRPEESWYRTSCIFGEAGIEFGLFGEDTGKRADKILEEAEGATWDQVVKGKKPLGTNCDCGYRHPKTKLLRVGRFGMWDRRRLLHEVPKQVETILEIH